MLDDTIAAVSSPPGASPRGVIRVSGPEALRVAGTIFRPECDVDWAASPGHRRWTGRLHPACVPRDGVPAVAYVFRAPRSYTRQDVVELHLPGSPGLLALAMDALLSAGARPAEPGEFTARAVRNGALDLARAEGVAEMIYARSDGQLRAARNLMDGALSRDAAAARDSLDDLRALVEAALDFADQDIEFIRPSDLASQLRDVADRLRETARADARVERLAEPPTVVLCGPPNAGKSTLMNRLTGVDRAICSPLAGTTRDVLTAPIRLRHGEALLCDTAGLDATDAARMLKNPDGAGVSSAPVAMSGPAVSSAGSVSARAARAARETIARASLVLWVTAIDDLVAPPPGLVAPPAERGASIPGPRMFVVNKADLPVSQDLVAASAIAAALDAPGPAATPAFVSARTGAGCAELLDRVDALLHLESIERPDVVLLSADLRRAVADSVACVDRAIELAEGSGDSLHLAELVAAELHDAARRLGRLTGEPDVEDLYDRIFARFCIGK